MVYYKVINLAPYFLLRMLTIFTIFFPLKIFVNTPVNAAIILNDSDGEHGLFVCKRMLVMSGWRSGNGLLLIKPEFNIPNCTCFLWNSFNCHMDNRL